MPRTAITAETPLNPQQEIFALNYASSDRDNRGSESAILAGYSPHSARFTASKLLHQPNIKARISQITQQAVLVTRERVAVMLLAERMERCSEIARARISDFVVCDANGVVVGLTEESVHSASIKTIKTRREIIPSFKDDEADGVAIITEISLHAPATYIDLLNKMDGIYDDDNRGKGDVNVAVQNNTFNVISPRGSELIQEALDGRILNAPDHVDD